MLKIAVLGAGVMATALTFPAVENGNEVRLIGTHLDDVVIEVGTNEADFVAVLDSREG